MLRKLSKRARKSITRYWYDIIVVRQMRVAGRWALGIAAACPDDPDFEVEVHLDRDTIVSFRLG